MSLCLWGASTASAADLVQFLGAGTTYGSVLSEAGKILSDPSQLGFNSSGYDGQKDFDDRSGEFSIEVYDGQVQVAFFSDDGVNVQVTDMGEIDDPLGSEPVSLSGLENLGKGQALPDLGNSIKLIPATFSPNHRYKFEWQFRNTLYTGGGDIDGMKVFVFGGGAQLALAKTLVMLSPVDTGTPNPTPGEMELIAEPSEWNNRMFISPAQGAKVSPRSFINLGFTLVEMDSVQEGTKKPIQIPNADATIKVYLKLVGAMFDLPRKNTRTVTLNQTSPGVYTWTQDVTQILISKRMPWPEDVKLWVSCVDPGNDPPEVTKYKNDKKFDVQGQLKDSGGKEMTWLLTWKQAPADAKLPKTITAIKGRFLRRIFDDFPEFTPLATKMPTEKMRFTYQYGPDLKQDGTPNYEGIVVDSRLEDSGDSVLVPLFYSTSYEGRGVGLINSIIKKGIDTNRFAPLTRFDEYYNEWVGSPIDASYNISTGPDGLDITTDTYEYSKMAKKLALEFLGTPPPFGSPVTVTVVQRYYCNNVKLTGSMPTEVIGTFTRDDKLPLETHEQQVKNQ